MTPDTTRSGRQVVRVTDTATGHRITITKQLADAEPRRYQPVDGPAVDHAGNPLPPKFHRTAALAEVRPPKKETPA